MQKTFGNIFLLLSLCLLLNIILVLYCYSDLGNSLLSDSVTVIDPDIRNSELSKSASILNSVMAPKTIMRGTKRLLQQYDPESSHGEEKIRQIRSKRWKAVCHPQTAEVPITEGGYSHSIGQAFYQRIRQGFATEYEDSGDNIYKCSYCDAYFWFEEAVKQSSTNAEIIYTNCCQKGQVKLPKKLCGDGTYAAKQFESRQKEDW